MPLRDELADYASGAQARIEDSPQMDEQNTKRKLIEPLLECLGWDILSSEVELEYSVQMGSGTKKVDYALTLEETPVVFLEAKGCDTDLKQSHRDQLRSYMRQVGVEWGLLSNGRTFEIYRRDYESEKPAETRLAAFPIGDTPDNESILQALTRSKIASGESRQIAERVEAAHTAVRELRENKETLAGDVTSTVTAVTGQAVAQHVEEEAKTFVDELIQVLEEQANRAKSVETPPAPGPDGGTGTGESSYTIRVLENGSEIHRVTAEMQAETMGALVEYLIEHHNLLEAVELPYVPGTGRGSRALLNDIPEHIDGTEMRQYQTVAGNYYLFTALSSEDKQRYLSELPSAVDLECEFVGDW